MPKFSQKSLDKLSTCHRSLQAIFREVIEHQDCIVLEGHRNEADQNEAYRTGHSKLTWPNGKHNLLPSSAVDVAPFPLDWNDTQRFHHFAGFVLGYAARMGIQLRWGGDWDGDGDTKDQTLVDLVHFELLNP